MKPKTTRKEMSSYANINQTEDVESKFRPPKVVHFVKILLIVNLSWNIISIWLEYCELYYGMQM